MFPSKVIKSHLYLEGIEIDFNSVNITETVGAPPTAVVSLPPTMHIYNILPKTVAIITVEIEVRDPETGVTIQDDKGNKVFEELVQFFGELRGYGLNRTAASAEVELTFMGFTDNWTVTPVVPVDSSIPTLTTAQMVGINHYRSRTDDGGKTYKEAYKSYGIFYKGFPTLLLGFADILQKETPGPGSILHMVTINTQRDVAISKLLAYTNKLKGTKGKAFEEVMKKRMSVEGTSPRSLQTALQYMAKNFLLNYGVFCETLTKALSLDTMISYVGSDKTASFFKNDASVSYLRNGIKNMSGSLSIHEVFSQILPTMRYSYQEFAAPVIAPDTSNGQTIELTDLPAIPIQGMTVSKILFSPRTELFAPIANNTIFDDNIITAAFSRDLCKEPTRLIRLAPPFSLQNGQGVTTIETTLATIVPQNIILGNALSKLASHATRDYKTFGIAARAGLGVNEVDIEKKIKENADQVIKDQETHLQEAKTLYEKCEQQQMGFARYYALYNDAELQQAQINAKQATDDLEALKPKNGKPADFQIAALRLRRNKIFGLTAEENLRGVVPDVYSDESGIEYAYLLDVINKGRKKPYKSIPEYHADDGKGEKKLDDTHSAVIKNLNDPTDPQGVSSFYMMMADYDYREHRRRARTLNLSTDYSPYRVCGYTGLVFIKDIGYMVGVLNSISTRISADGQASQSLAFTHLSILTTNNVLASQLDFSDNYTDELPGYLSEFSIDKVGKILYSYVAGREDAALHDYVNAHYKNQKNIREFHLDGTTESEALVLENEYQKITDVQELERFVYKLTWRNLATMGQLMSVLANATKGLKGRAATDVIAWQQAPCPFVIERQNAVVEIFKLKSVDDAAWKDTLK